MIAVFSMLLRVCAGFSIRRIQKMLLIRRTKWKLVRQKRFLTPTTSLSRALTSSRLLCFLFLCIIHLIGALLNNVCLMNVEIINNSRHAGEILFTEITKRELCELMWLYYKYNTRLYPWALYLYSVSALWWLRLCASHCIRLSQILFSNVYMGCLCIGEIIKTFSEKMVTINKRDPYRAYNLTNLTYSRTKKGKDMRTHFQTTQRDTGSNYGLEFIKHLY